MTRSPDRPRLIESAFPLRQASIDSVHEKNVRHGHISTLHTWPARRPLALSERASSVACNTTAELILKVLPQRDGLPRAPSMQRFIAAFRNSSPGVTHRVRAAQHIMLSCAASCQSNLLHHDVSGVRSLLVKAIHRPMWRRQSVYVRLGLEIGDKLMRIA